MPKSENTSPTSQVTSNRKKWWVVSKETGELHGPFQRADAKAMEIKFNEWETRFYEDSPFASDKEMSKGDADKDQS